MPAIDRKTGSNDRRCNLNRKKVGYIYLAIAIIAEVAATLALKASEGFTRLTPTLIAIVGYGTTFYCLTLVLRTISTGTAYALWAGLGIVLVALVSAILFTQIPDLPAVIGMLLIVAGVLISFVSTALVRKLPDLPAVIGMLLIGFGVVVIHLFSKTVAH